MTLATNQSFAGIVTLLCSSVINVMRQFGIPVSPEREAAINQLMILALGAYLAWRGHDQAINTQPPGGPNA